MKVCELIRLLKEQDQNLDVYVYVHDLNNNCLIDPGRLRWTANEYNDVVIEIFPIDD